MSQKRRSISTLPKTCAPVFAALGDPTRLALLLKLSSGKPHSIIQLTRGSRLTRQAISKHLRVLQGAGMVSSVRAGRESRYQFEPHSIGEMKQYLDLVSEKWDLALGRLRAFVEG